MAKTLLIYASFGEGHKKAASSLKDFLNAPCEDLLDFAFPHIIKKIYPRAYLFVTEHLPLLWQFFFSLTQKSFVKFVLTHLHRCLFLPFFRYVEALKPEIIITTHFFPLPLISILKAKQNFKVITIVTDLRVHPLWVHKCVDKYVVAHDEGKRDLVNFGIGEGKIISGFVSLREGFLQDFSEEHVREKNSLDTRPCLLFMSSSRGRFPYIRETIHHLKDHFNILIIYGRNKKLKRILDGIDPASIKLFPFYENIWELVSVSSAIITKPGGLTVFEGIYKKKPLVFTYYMPGQERANMDLVTKYGVAKFVKNQRQFIEVIAEFAYNRTPQMHYPIEFKDIRSVLREVIHETMTDNG